LVENITIKKDDSKSSPWLAELAQSKNMEEKKVKRCSIWLVFRRWPWTRKV
jgi:hypothetical protein